MQIPLLKKLLIGQEIQIYPLFDAQMSQMGEQTMHEDFEFPYGYY
jgi:hypothetical protein